MRLAPLEMLLHGLPSRRRQLFGFRAGFRVGIFPLQVLIEPCSEDESPELLALLRSHQGAISA